jgi:hypothetical protein
MSENNLSTALQNLFRQKIAQYEKLTPQDKSIQKKINNAKKIIARLNDTPSLH